MTTPHPFAAYHEAAEAIATGTAQAHALWFLISSEGDRDGRGLKPMPWEGPGEYQYVTFSDGRSGLVRLPLGGRDLPCSPAGGTKTPLSPSSQKEPA